MKLNYTGGKIPLCGEYDVIVIGGGVSGITSSLAAARTGAKVLLIERSGQLGGIATSALMASMSNTFFDATGRQVVNGIPYEIVDSLVEKGVIPKEWMSPSVPHIPYNADEFEIVAYEKLDKDGVDVLMLTLATDVIMEKNKINYIICDNIAGKKAFKAKFYVDSTGDASIAAMSGEPYEYTGGNSSTLMFEMGNVNLDETFKYYANHPKDYSEEKDVYTSFEEFRSNYLKRNIFHIPHAGGLDFSPLQEAIKNNLYQKNKGLAEGLDTFGLWGIRDSKRVLVDSNFYNLDPINNIFEFSQAQLEGKIRCRETADILKKVMPGFENAYMTRIASEIGLRTSRRIRGRKELKLNDLEKPVKFPDVIAVMPGWTFTNKFFAVQGKKLGNFSVDIPLGLLLPQQVNNLIIGSGRSVSSREAVMSAVRTQLICMTIGQASGVAAAKIPQSNETINDLIILEIQKELLNQKVYLGNNERLKELGLEK